MKLSAPIFRLKREAKLLSRGSQIPHTEALDKIARQEGFESWSLLSMRYSLLAKSGRIFAQLKPGMLVLVAARPGQGKTVFCLELTVEAMKVGFPSRFFSLEFTESECLRLLKGIGHPPGEFGDLFEFDGSDAICAAYIVTKMASAMRGTLVIVDYLQLLDQRRDTAPISVQIAQLRALAQEKGLTMIFVSQIDRRYDPSTKPLPDMADIRLPNPLDLKLFDKACFLHDGDVKVTSPK